MPWLDTKANASMDVLGGGFKPSVALCLEKRYQRVTTVVRVVGGHFFENVVNQGIMCIVIHGVGGERVEWSAHRKVNGSKLRGEPKKNERGL